MPSRESTRPSYERAFLAVPYALPATVGAVFLLWGALELVSILTTSYGGVADLFETLVILAVGTASLFYGVAGGLVVAVRTSGLARSGAHPSR